jgi:hypothetical protein
LAMSRTSRRAAIARWKNALSRVITANTRHYKTLLSVRAQFL